MAWETKPPSRRTSRPCRSCRTGRGHRGAHQSGLAAARAPRRRALAPPPRPRVPPGQPAGRAGRRGRATLRRGILALSFNRRRDHFQHSHRHHRLPGGRHPPRHHLLVPDRQPHDQRGGRRHPGGNPRLGAGSTLRGRRPARRLVRRYRDAGLSTGALGGGPCLEDPVGQTAAIERDDSLVARHRSALSEVNDILGRIWKWVLIGIGVDALFHGFVPAGIDDLHRGGSSAPSSAIFFRLVSLAASSRGRSRCAARGVPLLHGALIGPRTQPLLRRSTP